MFAWLAENLGTIVISAVLLAIVAAIVIYLIRQKSRAKAPAALAARIAQTRAAAIIMNERSFLCIKPR